MDPLEKLRRLLAEWLGQGETAPFDAPVGAGFDDATAQIDEQTNRWSFNVQSGRIITQADLEAVYQIDLDEWRSTHFKPNTWEIGAKIDDELVVETLYQCKATYVRRNPVPVMPLIEPISPTVRFSKPAPPARRGLLRSLVWADPHFGFTKRLSDARLDPFHDRLAWDLVLQVSQAARPDRIDGLGDLLDLPEWSDKFVRSPEFFWTTRPALLEAHWWLTQLRQVVPDAPIYLHEGNHDKRLPTMIYKYLPAAYDLRPVDMETPVWSMPYLLGLDELGIEWIGGYPADGHWLEDIELKHGAVARKNPGDTVKAIVMDSDVSKMVGHIHRAELVSRRRSLRDGWEIIQAVAPGTLARIDGVVPGETGDEQRQQGLAIVDYDLETGLRNINPVLIDRGRLVWNGQVFEARDRLPEIAADFPGWNWGS